ncbi:alkaline phosphatase family protein [Candidatus Micrarchaeota archaeon]|nr:alkaline phosphatase family protein [Candidatus Micrarchaeota archaeon]
MKKRVVIIGIDGGNWNILYNILSKLPTLKHITENGCCGTLFSTFPYVTAPAWTSAFTGMNPGKHGIFDFFKYPNYSRKLVTSSDIKSSLVWETLSNMNKKSIVIGVPLTYPVTEINGLMVSGFGAPGTHVDFVYPYNLKDEILNFFPNYRISPNHVYENGKDIYLKELIEIANQKSEITKLFVNKYPDWDLLITVFSCSDWVQHWYQGDERSIYQVYKIIDDFLFWVLKNLYDKNTTIILISDHGFQEINRICYINTYLKQQGYLRIKKNILKSMLSTFGITRRTIRALDSLNLRRFVPSSAKEKLPVNVFDSSKIDFEQSQCWMPSSTTYGLFVKNGTNLQELIKKLTSLCDPSNGNPIFKKILKKEQVFWGQHLTNAPDLIFIPNSGYYIAEGYSQKLLADISSTNMPRGAHNLTGMYAVLGNSIEAQKMDLVIWDIASLVFTLFDMPVPSKMDGKVHEKMFKRGRKYPNKKFYDNTLDRLKQKLRKKK